MPLETKTKSKQPQKLTYYQGVGRRREASATVRLYPLTGAKKDVTVDGRVIKKGEIVINGKPIAHYFPGQMNEKLYSAPLKITGTESVYAISVHTQGGGIRGQLAAFIHGTSRALDAIDIEKNHLLLKKRGFLTRDARVRERRKVGLGGRARAKKQSPKR